MSLKLPYPPTVNHLYFNTAKGRVKSQGYTAWLTEAQWMIHQQRPTPVKGPYRLTVIVTRPDKRRRDVANLEKAVSDVLVKAGIVEDDSLCQSLTFAWAWDSIAKGGDVALTVEAANHPIFLLGRAA